MINLLESLRYILIGARWLTARIEQAGVVWVGWPFGNGSKDVAPSGFIWGISPDEDLLKRARKQGKKDADHNPPEDGEWPRYLKQLLDDVASATLRRADELIQGFAVPRATAEDCLAAYDEADRKALIQAIHNMADLLAAFDGKLKISHLARLSMQSSYLDGLDRQQGAAYWTPPDYKVSDPVPQLRKQLTLLAQRANTVLTQGNHGERVFPDDIGAFDVDVLGPNASTTMGESGGSGQ